MFKDYSIIFFKTKYLFLFLFGYLLYTLSNNIKILAFIIFCMFGGDGLKDQTSCQESVLVLGFDSRGDKTLLDAI